MPELAMPQRRGIALANFQPINPASYINPNPPPPPAIDTTGAAGASGKAALYGSISQVLSSLPEKLAAAYKTGRELKIGDQITQEYNEVSADPARAGELSNFAVSSEGTIKYSPYDADMRRAQLAVLEDRNKTPYEKMRETLRLPSRNPAAAPLASIPTAAPSVPSSAPLANFTSPAGAAAPALPVSGASDPVTGDLGLPGESFVPAGKDASQVALAAQQSAPVEPPLPVDGDTAPMPVGAVSTQPGIYEREDGTIVENLPNGKIRQWGPRDNTWVDVTPDTKDAQGLKFKNPEAARLAGYDPEAATVNPDGTITVTKFKSSGTDAKGRAKLNQAQETALTSASALSKSIDGLMERYDMLDKDGMAGPINGRIEKAKQGLGLGSEEGSKVQAEMNTALFRIARMLNGAGVLTDRDIARAEGVAPTITMTRGQFKGQLDAVKGVIKDGLETWIQNNAGKASDEQAALAKEAIASLTGQASPSKPASAQPAAAPASMDAKDSAAMAWLTANPTHPKAASVAAALKAKGVLP